MRMVLRIVRVWPKPVFGLICFKNTNLRVLLSAKERANATLEGGRFRALALQSIYQYCHSDKKFVSS